MGTVKHPDLVMVWCVLGFHNVGKFVVLPKNITVNKMRYLELLADYLEDCFTLSHSGSVPAGQGTCSDSQISAWLAGFCGN